jgi:outer membrane protein
MTSNSVLTAALVVTAAALVTHSQTPPAPTPTATKVAIIDIQAAILNSQEGQKAFTALRNRFEPRRVQIQKRQEELQTLQDRLNKGAATMTDAANEDLAAEIQSKTRALKHDAEDLEADAAEAQNKLGEQLGPKMYDVVGKYAGQRGYHVVLDPSNPQAPVYWADSSAVITADLVKQYDLAHPSR